MRVILGRQPSLVFEEPLQIWAPSTLNRALEALRSVDDALNSGYYVAGALSYELGALLQGLAAHASSLPLLILGAFRAPREQPAQHHERAFAMAAPLCRVSSYDYKNSIRSLLERIHDGDVYQVNYSVPFDVAFAGHPLDAYIQLAEHAGVEYPAFLEHEAVTLASLSPELFLRFEGDRISAKPMKGTAPLSRVAELDGEKNRAEHLMIVDLVRNDLHRICSDVQVTRLFDVERYPTFATMTSTISGASCHATFARIIEAAFPCGSVTGAPKRAAMQEIVRLERQSRGFYTGSIGYLSPERRGWWNVAIRTLQFDPEARTARFDAGGGIVSDSRAESEWHEILLKSRFLAEAWTAFCLIETFRCGSSDAIVAEHLGRLCTSAAAFGCTVDRAKVLDRLHALTSVSAPQLVRIQASLSQTHVTRVPLRHSQEPVRLCLSSVRVHSGDPLLRHKTSWRPVHDTAADEALERGCFDAILLNERDEVTEGSRTNIFVKKGGTLYTPPLSSGLLPGILRSRLLAEGGAVERVLFLEDICDADGVYAGNSARGLLRAVMDIKAD